MLILGRGLNLYTASEVVAALMLSGVVIVSLGLPVTIAYVIWHAGKRVASWARVPSRNPTLMTCQTADVARPRANE
jgi:hypothetical protein